MFGVPQGPEHTPHVPGQPGDPALRIFHLRFSYDPVVLQAAKSHPRNTEILDLFLQSPPDVIGNARVVRDAHRRALENAGILGTRAYTSIRDAATHQVVSIEEIRLIAALFCED